MSGGWHSFENSLNVWKVVLNLNALTETHRVWSLHNDRYYMKRTRDPHIDHGIGNDIRSIYRTELRVWVSTRVHMLLGDFDIIWIHLSASLQTLSSCVTMLYLIPAVLTQISSGETEEWSDFFQELWKMLEWWKAKKEGPISVIHQIYERVCITCQ